MPEPSDVDFAVNCADNLPGYRQKLIIQYQLGVRRAIESVLGRYTGHAQKRWEADDLCQEFFTSLLENEGAKLRSFQARNGSSLRTWLHIVAVRRVLNHLRQSHRNSQFMDEASDGCSDNDLPADEVMIHREAAAFIRQAVSQLSDMNRLVFRLIYEDGLSYEEAAVVCRMSKGALYTRAFRIKARLREKVEAAGFL